MTHIETQEIIDAYLDHQRQGKAVPKEQLAAMFPSREQEILSLLHVVEHLENDVPNRAHLMPKSIPQELAREFSIVRLIGSGGAGCVFEAIHRRRDKVALKLIPRQSEGFRIERFEREVKIASQLHHSHIVPVYDYGVYDDLCYISMQFVEGMDLAQLIKILKEKERPTDKKRRQLIDRFDRNWMQIARLGFDVAKSLEYAHQNSILHRDVKPANLLLDLSGKVWVTDFGLAKFNQPDHTLTQSGRTVGTIRYMAPEQIDNKADQRSDIYCLGLTLYELAFPNSPSFSSPVTRHPLTRPSTDIDEFPKQLEQILFKACDPDPTKRFQSTHELSTALGQFCDIRRDRIKSKRHNFVAEFNKLLIVVIAVVLAMSLLKEHQQAVVLFNANADGNSRTALPTEDIPSENGYQVIKYKNSDRQRMTTRIASSLDDAEEGVFGKVSVADDDLNMVWDGSSNTVGLRFRELLIPKNAEILSAHIQFTCSQSSLATTRLTIRGELSNNSEEFLPAPKNITERATTNSQVRWQVPHWEKGDCGPKQKSPDLAGILRELIRQRDRSENAPVTFIISGHGRRTCVAFEQMPELAPKLFVEFIADE